MRRTRERIRQEELADIYSALTYFGKYYDDAESEVQIVLEAIKDVFIREYGTEEDMNPDYYLHNRRGAGRKSKLSDEDKAKMRQMRREKRPVSEIAAALGVSERYIYKLLRGD